MRFGWEPSSCGVARVKRAAGWSTWGALCLLLLGEHSGQAQRSLPRLTSGAQQTDGAHAWSADSAYFIHSGSFPLETTPYGVRVLQQIVLDSRTGLSQAFELGPSDPARLASFGDEEKAIALDLTEAAHRVRPPIGKTADFTRWQASHPSQPCRARRLSPDGQGQATVVIRGGPRSTLTGRWVGQQLLFVDSRWQSTDDEPNLSRPIDGFDSQISVAAITVAVSRNGQRRRLYPLELTDTLGPLKGELSLCWSPDGRRVAVITHQLPHMTHSFPSVGEQTQVTVLPVAGLRVHLLASPARLAAAATKVAEALEPSGQSIVIQPVARDEKSTAQAGPPPAVTVLRAVAAARPAAQRVAAALSGRVEALPLPDASPYDLAIEIGER